jgi:putative transposase
MSDRMRPICYVRLEVGVLEAQAPGGAPHAFGPRRQYASDEHRQLIKDYRMIRSMSTRGSCWDNAAMESFFKTLNVERVYQLRYATRADARLDIVDRIEGFYNRRRMHSSINYQTPVDAECRRMAG